MRMIVALLRALLVAAPLLAGSAGVAGAIETAASNAILVDFDTGAVLMEKDADASMFPASMTKIMTAYLVFERLKEGRLSLDDRFVVSEEAWRKGGSKMFVEVGDRVRVEELLQGVIVQSGNDASIVLAEGIAGTEAAFAELMTEKARALGMRGTNFRNATGWPDPEHVTTARDLALLSTHVIRDFPEYYAYFSEKEFTYAGITQGNRNPLLYKDMNVDGLKTGHTEASGFGLTASAERDGRRLVLVINGLDSARARSQESERLLKWGFAEFGNYALFRPGDTVAEANVWLGAEASVPLVVREGLTVTIPRRARAEMKVSVAYEGPVAAPIEAGAIIGALTVRAPGIEPIERPLYAGATVERLALFGRLTSALKRFVLSAARL